MSPLLGQNLVLHPDHGHFLFLTHIFSGCPYFMVQGRVDPQGVLPNKEVGGLGPHIKFGGKIWGKVVRSSSPNNRKNLGSSVTTRRKSWEKNPNFGVISEIQSAKFGVFVTYIFGGKIWGSNKNFRGKFWVYASRPPYMEVPPGRGSRIVIFWREWE